MDNNFYYPHVNPSGKHFSFDSLQYTEVYKSSAARAVPSTRWQKDHLASADWQRFLSPLAAMQMHQQELFAAVISFRNSEEFPSRERGSINGVKNALSMMKKVQVQLRRGSILSRSLARSWKWTRCTNEDSPVGCRRGLLSDFLMNCCLIRVCAKLVNCAFVIAVIVTVHYERVIHNLYFMNNDCERLMKLLWFNELEEYGVRLYLFSERFDGLVGFIC